MFSGESEAGDWVDVDDTVKKGGFSYADAIKSLGKASAGMAAPRHLPCVPLEYKRTRAKSAIVEDVEKEEVRSGEERSVELRICILLSIGVKSPTLLYARRRRRSRSRITTPPRG